MKCIGFNKSAIGVKSTLHGTNLIDTRGMKLVLSLASTEPETSNNVFIRPSDSPDDGLLTGWKPPLNKAFKYLRDTMLYQ